MDGLVGLVGSRGDAMRDVVVIFRRGVALWCGLEVTFG